MAAPNLPILARPFGRSFGRWSLILAAGGLALSVAGCIGYDGVINRGAVFDQRKAAQIKTGMAAPQVLSVLGTPSTTSTVGGDAWYYFSQRTERPVAFMPQKVTDQHVLAIYFDKSKNVQRIADYGMEDGKTVDFNSRQTATTGPESNIVQGLLTRVIPF